MDPCLTHTLETTVYKVGILDMCTVVSQVDFTVADFFPVEALAGTG